MRRSARQLTALVVVARDHAPDVACPGTEGQDKQDDQREDAKALVPGDVSARLKGLARGVDVVAVGEARLARPL